MRRVVMLLWILGFLGFGEVYGEEATWAKIYGGRDDEEATSVVSLPDGGFLVAGWTESFGAGWEDVWLLRFEGEGPPEGATIVWPGDANGDGKVWAQDVIPIGVHYGKTGPTRWGGTTWFKQWVQGWSEEKAARADCNGDGKVDEKDVDVIAINWGRRVGQAKKVALSDSLEPYRMMYKALSGTSWEGVWGKLKAYIARKLWEVEFT